ncbi:hypothetical protein GCM10023210_07500 [Chryseobacterium ginsengisoli]|uniref:RGS domain-containing protein n=2 Tax=Chryseobacterium ginsengisoli TaxID=363853 RepID=A0ABP9LZ89_9FLAO
MLNAQLSNKAKILAKRLDTLLYAESSHIGIDGEENRIYNYFKKLSKIASNDELYYFAKNGSNALKLYSSKELLKRNDKRFLEIYKYYSDNPLIMKYWEGCISKKENIANYLKGELYSAKFIVSLRDSILKEKRSNLIESQLKSIYEEGYKNLSQKNLDFYLNEIEK